MLDYEFAVEQTVDRRWIIVVCPPFGESITLPGVYETKNAALAALARSRFRWTERQSAHGFRVIDGGQNLRRLPVSDR